MRKNILILILIVLSISCSNNDDNKSIKDNTIIGRWHVVDFEDTVMYEFTNDLRYTIYSTDGNFDGLDSAIPNPNTWTNVDDELVIDLNFGNFLRAIPNFKCDGNVVDLVSQNGTTVLFRENYIFNNCNE
ncbi:hypothetical protein [uncultured Algibacter sp.]|uniref:hypothetical protein n=1 Tax=uncultured Algibacter sp. TaxID=298659 RepID=UPI002632CA17|nr:hypothetical protein [uncultured Algibacter sp.]